jgi:HlyD family secretion protein
MKVSPAMNLNNLKSPADDHDTGLDEAKEKRRARRAMPAKKSQAGKWIFRSVLLMLLFVGCILGFIYLLPLLGYQTKGNRPIVATVIRGELKILVGDRGELESVKAVQVINDLEGGGKLVSIIDEGKRVKKGDVCCQIDTDAFLKELSLQEIKYQTAEGKVKTSISAVSQARNKGDSEINKADLTWKLAVIDLEAYDDPQGEYQKDLEKAKGVLELNRKQLKESEDELIFTRDMVKDGHIPPSQLRPKEQSVEQRKFEVKAAEAELTVLQKFTRKKKITELEAKSKETKLELERTKEIQKSAIDSAIADQKAAESNEVIEKKQMERIKEQIDRCTIKAPADGIVVYSNSRWSDESSRIRPGAQLYYRQEIFQLPDLSNMKIKLKIHESVIKKVQVGMPATITLDALQNRVLHGKVLKIATIAQADGWRGGGIKQYETEVSIEDLPSEAGLKPGMTGMVNILVGTIPDCVSVPVSAVTEYNEIKVVYIVNGSTITRREVQVGESNDQFMQIISGLEPGEEVAMDARNRAAMELKQTDQGKEKDKQKKSPSTGK